MSVDSYRLSVELPNGAKFRAQGEPSDVRVDLDRFYALLVNVSPIIKPTINGNGASDTAAAEDTTTAATDNGGDLFGSFTPTQQPTTGLDSQTLDRLFAKNGAKPAPPTAKGAVAAYLQEQERALVTRLAAAGINIEMVSTSEVRVNVVVQGDKGPAAMRKLQEAFADVLR